MEFILLFLSQKYKGELITSLLSKLEIQAYLFLLGKYLCAVIM